MFVNKPRPKPPIPHVLPEGATEHWIVKYPQGRKPLPTREAADDLATEARAAPKGWAEITHVIETVVSAR